MIKRITLTALIFVAMVANAAQEIVVRNNDSVEVTMSQGDLNRIAIVNDEIKSVFASQDKVHILPEEDKGQIFVTPKNAKSKPFNMSLTTRSGATIDLMVKPTKTSSQTILLTLDKRGTDELTKEQKQQERQIKQLIKAAMSGKTLKGYRILAHEDKSVDKNSKSLIQKQTYIGSKYKMLVFEYTNLKRVQETISEQMFQMSPDTIAIAVNKKTLKPKEKAKVIVVEDNKQQIKHFKR